ncbi:septum formation family protein [Microbacterium sp.]|uniref:septum formation family protein n=1 Tax=Microbacterium sp. TaxID=51671 RepID=UPI003A838256
MRHRITALALGGALVASTTLLGGCSIVQSVLGGDTAVRDQESAEITEGGTMDVFTLAVGDCFDDEGGDAGEISELPVVPCAEPHDNEVFYEFALADGEFPGNDEIYAEADAACLEEFTSFVGTSYEESVYGFLYLTPTKGGWSELGDRIVQCYLYEPGEKLTGSAAGTAR